MSIGKRTRVLVAVLALKAAILNPLVGSVQAADESPADVSIQCVWIGTDGLPHYYPPGTILVEIRSGVRHKCGKDGHWHTVTAGPPEGGLPGGGVYAP